MIFASNNKGKIKEIKEIFKNYEILSLNDVNIDIDIDEDGKTFYDNAYKKAKTIFDLTGIPTLADGCAVKTPGNITFEIVKKLVDQIITVTEDEIAAAITLLSDAGKIVAEGAGAMPTAAIASGKIKVKKGSNIALLVSGGNIDTAKFYTTLSKGLELLNRKVKFEIELKDTNRVKKFFEIH